MLHSIHDAMTAPAEKARNLSLVFTDLADSTALKTEKGDRAAGDLISRHCGHVERLAAEAGGRIVDWAGDGCFLTFEVSSAAVLFALRLQQAHAADASLPGVRVGIHVGEVTEKAGPAGTARVEGLAVDLASRIQSLARPGQVLMSSAVFDSVRQRLRGEELGTSIEWRAHGAYELKGIDGSVNICEAGIEGLSPLSPPAGSEKAHRAVTPGEEDTLGWRPAVGLHVQRRDHWVLEQQLGEGGFGEVWLAVHTKTKVKRVFKFCFEPERVRSLKREVVLFRLLKETLGQREDIAQIVDWEFERPPFFIESEYTQGGDLRDWAERNGGLTHIPLTTRLELVAQVAVALGAAHSVGVLHKDIKPANILITEPPDKSTPRASLTDFGIGMLTGRQALLGMGITAAGLTETLVSSSSLSSGAGTRLYMAPEVIEGKAATTLSDVYALGVLLYQMAMGDFRRALAPGWERDIKDPLLTEDIAACVEGDPERRLASAAELATRLRSLDARRAARETEENNRLAVQRAKRRRRQFVVVFAIGASLTLVVALFALRENQRAGSQTRLAQQEQQARIEAEAARREAERLRADAEHGKYVSDIRLADLAISNVDLGMARSRLELTTPGLRSWEWGHLVNKAFPPEGSVDASPAKDEKKQTAEEYWLGAEAQLVATIPGFQIPAYPGFQIPAYAVEFSPDGSRMAVRGEMGVLPIWDMATYTRLDVKFEVIPQSSGVIPHYDPTGTMLTIPSGNDVLILDAVTGLRLAKLSGHTNYATYCIFSPDSATVISSGYDFKLIGWDWRSGQQLWWRPLPDFYTQNEGVTRQIIRFLPGTNHFIVPERRTTIAVCDGATGQTIETFDIQQPEGFYPIWITPRADRIVYHDPTKGVFNLVEFPSGNQRAQWDQQVAPDMNPIQSSMDGTLMGVRTLSNGIVLLNVGSAAPLESSAVPAITGISQQVQRQPFAMSPDGRLIAVPESDGSILVFAPRKKTASTARPTMAHADTVHSARFAGTENHLLAASFDGIMRLWDLDTATVLKEIRAPGGLALLNLSPDNKRVFTVSYDVSNDGTYSAWDLETGDRVLNVPVGTGPNFAGGLREILVLDGSLVFDEARFSPDSRQLVTASKNVGEAIVWDTGTFAERHVLKGHKNFVYRGGFSPDGRQVLTHGYQETSVRLWNADSGELRSVLECGSPATHTTFSPDSAKLITTLRDGRLIMWDTASGEKIWDFKAREYDVLTVQINPAGDRFVTSGPTSALWDLHTGAFQTRFTGHTGAAFSALFNPAGDRVLTLGNDGTARIWDLQGNEMLSIQTGEIIHFGAWSPKGTRIVLTTRKGNILVYDSIPPAELASAGGENTPLRDRVLAWRERTR